MKKPNNLRRQAVALAAIAAIFLFGAVGSTFAQRKAAITEQEVKAYFLDWWTHDCDKPRECTVTFDSPVRIAPVARHTFQIPPATYMAIPVTVDMTTHANSGNFHLQHLTHGVYYFYRNSFGDWEMGKEGERITEEKDEHQEGGTAKAPATKGATGNRQAGNSSKTVTASGRPATSAPPVPDFSEMDDYYEVVRYEYPKAPSTEMYLYLKPKVELSQRPQFYIQFRDKDGILIGEQNQYGNGIGTTPMYNTQIGETGKAWAYIPTEKEMEKVVSAKVVRIKQ